MKPYFSKVAPIVVIFISMLLSSCNFNPSYTGEYRYTDALDHSYSLILYSNGDATLKMTSKPDAGLEEFAYSEVYRGISGYWQSLSFQRGTGLKNYASIYFGNDNLMICDGYIYSYYDDMTQNRTIAGNQIFKLK